MRSVGAIGYAVEPSPTQASVAGFVIGLGWGCCMVPVCVLTVVLHDKIDRWALVSAGFAICAIQTVVMLFDLRRLLGDSFHAPSPYKTMNQILSAIAAVTLIGIGIGGPIAEMVYRACLVMAILMVATIGNTKMMAVVVSVVLAAELGPAASQGADVWTLVALTGAFTATGVGAALMVRETRDAGIRAADRFDRLTETTEVILRADGFVEALAHFLPLVAGQVGCSNIAVFVDHPNGERTVLNGLGDTSGDEPHWTTPEGATNGFDIGGSKTFAWARGDDGRSVVLVIQRQAPNWRRRVPFYAALRQLAPELELLLRHTDLLVQMEKLSRTDILTGLPNRLDLMSRLKAECSRSLRTNDSFCVAMIDLDEFKSYNDTFGHIEGDHALEALGQLFLTRVRGTDFICRYGGEEFCLLMPTTGTEAAEHLLDQLRTLAGALPAPRPLSFSAGAAEWQSGQSIEAFLRRADDALYRAKAAGRHRTAIAPRSSDVAASDVVASDL